MHTMRPLAAVDRSQQTLMYGFCFGEQGTRGTNSFGSLRVLMSQDNGRPRNLIDSSIKRDGVLVSHITPAVEDDPTILIVLVDRRMDHNDQEENTRHKTGDAMFTNMEDPLCCHPARSASQFDSRSGSVRSDPPVGPIKLKVRASECKTMGNGRHYYSARSLRRRLAQVRSVATESGVDSRTYQVVSSKNDKIIVLPYSTENIIDLFGSRIHISSNDDANGGSSYTPRIKGRHFEFDGSFTLGQRRLNFLEQTNRHNQGTSYNVWDGALLLARYLEHAHDIVKGLRVLELGAGCGVAGLSAAALGASYVTMTDLPGDILEHLQRNIDANEELLEECRVEAIACDWRDPPHDLVAVRKYDCILIADCIWLEELVAPLFDVLELLTRSAEHDDAPLVEETTESTTRIQPDDYDETFVPIQDRGKQTRDEKSSGTLDDSTHENFERGPLERHDAVGQSAFFIDDSEDCVSFYEENDVNTTKVLISYQRRGKSTHDNFMMRLHHLFSTVEIVEIPDQPEIFTIFSCQR